MKITRLKLVNFRGILNGTGLEEIEIKFTDKVFNMLVGGNGSGKTTILSQLHPFRESFDDRRDQIVEGKDGLKEIDIEFNGHKYEIVHKMSKVSKCYIMKDGVELNENGGVRTFESIVEAELEVTPDYLKIGKISSSTENFINLSTAERKKYISKFLPDIESYLEAYEKIREKNRDMTRDIKIVADELNKLLDITTIQESIETNTRLLETYTSDRDESNNRLGGLNQELTTLSSTINTSELPQITSEKNRLEKRTLELARTGLSFINRYGKKDTLTFNEERNTLLEKQRNNLVKIEELRSTKQGLISLKVSEENSKTQMEYTLQGYDGEYTLDDLNTKLKELQDVVDNIGTSSILEDIRNHENEISLHQHRYIEFMNFLSSNFTSLQQKTISSTQSNLEEFLSNGFSERIKTRLETMVDIIEGKEENIKNNTFSQLQMEEKYKEYTDHSHNDGLICKDPTCPFMARVREYAGLEEAIINIKGVIEVAKKDLEEYKTSHDNMVMLDLLFKNFIRYYNDLKPDINPLLKEFNNRNGSFVDMILNDSSTNFRIKYREVYDDFNTGFDQISTINKNNTEINNLKTRIISIKNSEEVKSRIQSNIKEKENIIKKYMDKHDAVESELNDLIYKNSLVEEDVTQYNLFEQARIESVDIDDKIKALSDEELSIITNRNRQNELNTEIKNLRVHLNNLRENIDSVTNTINRSTFDLLRVQNLREKETNLSNQYKIVELVRDALNPNKGIPLVFIQAYLDKIRDSANGLLEIAFDGDFEIDFQTSASDFLINVRVGEHIKDDILEASQGEIALTKISLSLALIEQSIRRYNIITLDEMDGMLDSYNRPKFIDMLHKQITNLGIEQVFVISHNNSFDNEEVGLIILPRADINTSDELFMSNKEILFKI